MIFRIVIALGTSCSILGYGIVVFCFKHIAACACAAADRKGFAQQLGRAIKRPSSTSDIPEEDPKLAASSFPPAYTGSSFVRPRSKVSSTGPAVEQPEEERTHGTTPGAVAANGIRDPSETNCLVTSTIFTAS